MRIGVLALQGGFAAHAAALRAIGHEAIEVRAAADLAGARGLVLPGGESTAIRTLLARDGGALELAMHAMFREGAPILATCAGLILACKEVRHPGAPSFGWIDAAVSRNGWGRQIASTVACDDDGGTPLVLIRAPRIVEVGPDVEVLVRYRGEPVAIRQGGVIGASFHPELTEDRRLHQLAFSV